ncbi:MAG: hypothetical protein LBN74_02210 [Prevotella sp.]|jgi:hypothetical protein|nr:hypothetical protein [Prevotella sp.]
MKKYLSILFCALFSFGLTLCAQTKKLPVEINSIHTKNIITLKYNAKNQLIHFTEKGTVIYREFTLKYDKANNQLIECLMNSDNGEMVVNSKFIYNNADYIMEEAKSSGKQLRSKITEYNKIYIDNRGRFSKSMFEDGKMWEEPSYDSDNNLVKYLVYSASGQVDIQSDYKFDTHKSIFSGIENLPLWFFAMQMNNMKWCGDFLGKNNAIENTFQDARFGTETIEITYEYDQDGYPVKQYYDGELAKEIKYITVR